MRGIYCVFGPLRYVGFAYAMVFACLNVLCYAWIYYMLGGMRCNIWSITEKMVGSDCVMFDGFSVNFFGFDWL